MAEAVVSSVVQSLGGFIIQEGKFLCGISDQVKYAQTQLQLMRGFLKDADARQQDEEIVRIWVAEIRDAAYELEDVIETFAFKVASKSKKGIKSVLKRFGCILIEGVRLQMIGSEIGNITTKISNLRLSLQNYNVREIRESGGATSFELHEKQQLRRTYSHVIESDVVGLEGSIKELVMHLVKDEHRHRVISIWGMGGLGKTTLAKQVYHHNEVRHHFACFAWVCITQRCQVREVWERILINLTSATNEEREEIAKLKDDEIAKKLYVVQKERRCLVVIDDIWTIETWNSLKAGFPYKEKWSRILLTTRNKEVASRADRNGFLYQPQPLNDDESWELLEKIAIFGKDIDSVIHGKMKELGRKMLNHCAGLPLAIRVLAGLLARKDTINEWDMVLNNVDVYIRKGKFHEQEYASSSWVLALSYDSLPYHLKLCFLYLGHFPEDFEIPVKRLTQLWMAEGLIFSEEQKRSSMEDVSYNCLNELVERCMVEVGKQGSVRKIKTCRLHDLMRHLCLLKAEEEKFLRIVNSWHRNKAMVNNETPISKARRLAIYFDKHSDKVFPPNDESDGHLRSLLYFVLGTGMSINKKLIRSLFKDFKLLRVLKFEHMTRKVKLPNEIGNLVHLRFLSLKGSNIKQLPSSIANLICLQTLDLRFPGLSIIPNVICKMEQLRHLYLPRYFRVSDKLHLTTLCNLQTLVNASCRDCDSNHLAQFTNLRKLCVVVPGRLKRLEEMFTSTSITFDHLRSLSVVNLQRYVEVVARIVLSCRYIYKLHLEGPTIELPNDLLHYPNLTKLSLAATFLKDDQMAILEKLPNLKNVHLGPGTFEENTTTLVFSRGGFPHLEFLYLGGMLEIEEWRVEEGALPNLGRLLIAHCEQLTALPDGLKYITTLKKLAIKAMPRTFYSRLQEGGEDFYKIQHVPSLVLGGTLEEFLSSLEKVIH
ncbi:hypothetical protein CerSpe_080040 [Prunus speciosa]